ncbi:peptidoglycan-binding domain-containing protein [Breoghania sp. L-A4]|uniref:peptidoglycan recognition protein family protein n=1 Tax=Breoghania sp. L-A4 TaxID=2304600 RepID=UPI000E35B157|nr:peptidoglycan-binding domain-containing protein [Breoghania sp. L-A4]AXS39285.1 peptidoglycan-binding domain-containing protein [Breoghania sp. L-A4]
MRPVSEIIVHCTATPEGRPVSVADIDAWHRARGWSGIGYHRVIGIKGERWQGRPLENIGAHVASHNTGTIGVTYVGGVATDGKTAKDTRTLTQKAALLAELVDLRDRFGITKVSGHNDYAAKACPSFDARAEYGHLFGAGRVPKAQPSTSDNGVLARGDSGPAVRAWRERLASYRRKIGHRFGVPQGDTFDHTIELVTIEFQNDRGIVVDGKVGEQTRIEMDRALSDLPPYQAIPAHNPPPDIETALRHLQQAITALSAA